MLFEYPIARIHLILDLILNIAKALMNRTILKSAAKALMNRTILK